jgi:hypothetical protein
MMILVVKLPDVVYTSSSFGGLWSSIADRSELVLNFVSALFSSATQFDL